MDDTKLYICLEAKQTRGGHGQQQPKHVYLICSLTFNDLTSKLSYSPTLTTETSFEGYPSMGCGFYQSKIVFAGGQVHETNSENEDLVEKSNYYGLSENEDLVEKNYYGLPENEDLVQSNYEGLLENEDFVQSNYDGLLENEDFLQNNYDGLSENEDLVQRSYNGLSKNEEEIVKQNNHNGLMIFDLNTKQLSSDTFPSMLRGKLKPLVFQIHDKLYVMDTVSGYRDGSFEYFYPPKGEWNLLRQPAYDDYINELDCQRNLNYPCFVFGNAIYLGISILDDNFIFLHHPNLTYKSWFPARVLNPGQQFPFSGVATFCRQDDDNFLIISLVNRVVQVHSFDLTGYTLPATKELFSLPSTSSESVEDEQLSGYFADFGGGIFSLTASDSFRISVYTIQIFGPDAPVLFQLLSHYEYRFDALSFGVDIISVVGCFAPYLNFSAIKRAEKALKESYKFAQRSEDNPHNFEFCGVEIKVDRLQMDDTKLYICLEAKQTRGGQGQQQQPKHVYLICSLTFNDLTSKLSDSPTLTTETSFEGYPSMGCGFYQSKIVFAGGQVHETNSENEDLVEKSNYSGLSENEDLVEKNYYGLPENEDLVQSNYEGLLENEDFVQSNYDGLLKNEDFLQNNYDGLSENEDLVQRSYNGLSKNEEEIVKQNNHNGLMIFDLNTKQLSSDRFPSMLRGKLKPLVFHIHDKLYVMDTVSGYRDGSFEYFYPPKGEWSLLRQPAYDDYINELDCQRNLNYPCFVFGNAIYLGISILDDNFIFLHHPNLTYKSWFPARVLNPGQQFPFSGVATFCRQDDDNFLIISLVNRVVQVHSFDLTGYTLPATKELFSLPSTSSESVEDEQLSGYFADFGGGIFSLTASDSFRISVYTIQIFGPDAPVLFQLLSHYEYRFDALSFGVDIISVVGCFAPYLNFSAIKRAEKALKESYNGLFLTRSE